MQEIEKLQSVLSSACVAQRAATSREQIERWQTSEFSYLKESYVISPAPAELAPLIQAALAEWDQIEASILNPPQEGSFIRARIDRTVFMDQFVQARALYLAGEPLTQQLQRRCLSLRGKVRNMEWVNLFALVLPVADPAHREENLARARMVVAIFYLESIGKSLMSPSTSDETALRKIEARWQLVAER